MTSGFVPRRWATIESSTATAFCKGGFFYFDHQNSKWEVKFYKIVTHPLLPLLKVVTHPKPRL